MGLFNPPYRHEDKIVREKEILEYADSLSREYYGLPLVVVYNGNKKILSLVREVLEDYEVSSDFIPHRMCVTDYCKKAFGLKGDVAEHDRFFEFEHTKEVFDEAVGDDVLDCLIVRGVRNRMNVMVNPYGR